MERHQITTNSAPTLPIRLGLVGSSSPNFLRMPWEPPSHQNNDKCSFLGEVEIRNFLRLRWNIAQRTAKPSTSPVERSWERCRRGRCPARRSRAPDKRSPELLDVMMKNPKMIKLRNPQSIIIRTYQRHGVIRLWVTFGDSKI